MKPFLVAPVALFLALQSVYAADSPAGHSILLGNRVIAPFAKGGDGGTRKQLLAHCKSALAAGTAGEYAAEFQSLVTTLEHEPPPPAGYGKAAKDRSPEETIRAAIYDLNGDRPYGPDYVVPGDVILAAGTAALGPLMETLDDPTPSRTIGEEAGFSLSILLRREDLALYYIERITGVSFFQRTQGRGGQFHNDPQRAVFLEKIRAWWKLAQGKSQADILRMEIARSGPEDSYLLRIAELEGPESVLQPLHNALARPDVFCDDPIPLSVLHLDPQPALRAALARFRAHRAHPFDYNLLARYGDQAIYRELAAQSEIDPEPWGHGGLSSNVSRQGGNWGIPLLAAMLTQTKMENFAPSRKLSPADFAMDSFEKLVNQDFGYNFDGAEADRLAAIEKARAWWLAEGQKKLAARINEAHSDRPTDLFATEAQLAVSAGGVASPQDSVARAAVASLPQTYCVGVQRALLARLAHESLPKERLAILSKFGSPSLWQAPIFADLFEHDPDLGVRTACGNLLSTFTDSSELSTYQRILTGARHVADDPKSPGSLVVLAARLLIQGDSSLDDARLRRLQPGFPREPVFERYVEDLKSLPERRHPEYSVQ